MAPASTMKRRKLSPNRGVNKTRGGSGRKRTEPDSEDDHDPVVTPPYKWSTNTTRKKKTRGGPKTVSERARAVTNDTDSADSTGSEDEDEDAVEVVGTMVTNKTRGNPTNAALRNQLLPNNTEDTIETLQESVAKLQARNQMLARQIKNITKMGGVDKYEVMQIRKMVKEDLFKRVKFITTRAVEAKCMQYLSNKMNIPTETRREWTATYAHCVRDALNNKRNNVSQNLKSEVKGKT
jgi:hypothetical protein